MLDWLKEILGEAYTDEIEAKAKKELANWGVPKSEFNAKVKKIGENEKTILEQTKELDNLRQTNVDAAAVQKQLAEKDEAHSKEINQLKLDFAVKTALKDAGAKNPATVMPLLEAFLKEAKFEEDGETVEGLSEKIRGLSEDDSTAFLFEGKTQAKVEVAGAEPGDPGNKGIVAKSPDEMTYDELCDYMEKNPNAKL